jgi:hypothetical protein
VAPMLVLTAIFNAAFVMVTSRGMLCRVRENGKVGYTALWILSISLAHGIPPIAAGLLIDALGMTGFRLCFLAAGISGLAAAGLMFRLAPEEGSPPAQSLHPPVRPAQPLRSLCRAFWITLGFGLKTKT